MAARYGRLFSCDPMCFLDLPPQHLDIAVAICEAAIADLEAERR